MAHKQHKIWMNFTLLHTAHPSLRFVLIYLSIAICNTFIRGAAHVETGGADLNVCSPFGCNLFALWFAKQLFLRDNAMTIVYQFNNFLLIKLIIAKWVFNHLYCHLTINIMNRKYCQVFLCTSPIYKPLIQRAHTDRLFPSALRILSPQSKAIASSIQTLRKLSFATISIHDSTSHMPTKITG